MGSITMWIVLGSLIGLVVIFLIVTSVLERRKSRRLKNEHNELQTKIIDSGENSAKIIIDVIRENEAMLEVFSETYGKYKMSEINSKSKGTLEAIIHSDEYRLMKNNEELYDEFHRHLKNLISEKSNNWSKRNQDDFDFFSNYLKEVERQRNEELENLSTESSKSKKWYKFWVKKETSKSKKENDQPGVSNELA